MKQAADKKRKQRQATSARSAKTACGTLSYLAECRGAMQKIGSTRWAAPPDSIDKNVRK